ncbi:NAD(+)/NADH kinase [Aeromicrobium stalagmiti]|uniref:NAD(+)/NADH kinase n=1 Tax=Aeromicrobium stalagmiti TaxID=2738988 RepID=UPI0015694026|nr:NAD(+)/NADH kinase [Aeromicrobium stalagmiti]
MSLRPRAVVVHRRSEYDDLVARHGTHRQAEFVLASRGRDIADVEQRHAALEAARSATSAAIPVDWRRTEVERSELDRFVFGPEDLVIAVGQDGLVANVAKYLSAQPVVGVNPEPAWNPGILVTHPPDAVAPVLDAYARGSAPLEERTMVEAVTDDGQVLRALNEVFIGHPSHQSARYVVQAGQRVERHSSSGILAGTGTGATGWLRSSWQERRSVLELPGPTSAELCWFVREAWPSPATGTTCTEGLIADGQALVVTVESDLLVCFGDGIEADALSLSFGQRLTVRRAAQRLRLVR